MREAGRQLRQQMMAEDDTLTEDMLIYMCVTFDGTWSKSGYTVNHCIGVTTSIETGMI